MLSTAFRLAFNPVTLSRLLGVVCQMSIVLVAPLVLNTEQTNGIYSIIAWSAIVSTLSSFGANAVLATQALLMEVGELQRTVSVLIISKLLSCLCISIIIHAFNNALDWVILFITSFTLSLNFIDFVAEAYGSKCVEDLALIKIPTMLSATVVKLFVVILYSSFSFWIIYVEWPILWILSYLFIYSSRGHSIYDLSPTRVGWSRFAKLFRKSFWPWISGILQLGWTRGLFLLLSTAAAPTVANSFFLFTRIVEGFAFIPNAISTQFFPSLVRAKKSDDRIAIRRQFMAIMQLSAIMIAASGPLVVAIMAAFSSAIQAPVLTLLLMAIAGFFFVLRVAVSREIVLQDLLFLSLSSYLAGILANAGIMWIVGVQSLNAVMVGYAAFMAVNFAYPVMAEWKAFRDFRRSLGISHVFKK